MKYKSKCKERAYQYYKDKYCLFENGLVPFETEVMAKIIGWEPEEMLKRFEDRYRYERHDNLDKIYEDAHKLVTEYYGPNAFREMDSPLTQMRTDLIDRTIAVMERDAHE